MERLTGSKYASLVEAYSSMYNKNSETEINEKENIQEFLELVDVLVEEGYDLSEYTYDELYESYLDEGWRDAVVKGLVKYGGKALQAGKSALKTAWRGHGNTPGAKEGVKKIVAGIGKVSPYVAAAAIADKAATGGWAARQVGGGIQNLRALGHNLPDLPSPGQAGQSVQDVGKGLEPYVQDPRQQKKKDSWASAPGSLIQQSTDLFDIIKGHLLDEGYADNEEAALAIMANMSEEWKKSILSS